MTAAINGDGSFRGGFKNGAAHRPYVNPSTSRARARARRKFKVATVRVFSGTGVRAERGRGRQVPLKTGGYQRERELGGTPLRDVGRGPLEESRGHSITF